MEYTKEQIKSLEEKAKKYDDLKEEIEDIYLKDYEDESDFIYELQDLIEQRFRLGGWMGC